MATEHIRFFICTYICTCGFAVLRSHIDLDYKSIASFTKWQTFFKLNAISLGTELPCLSIGAGRDKLE